MTRPSDAELAEWCRQWLADNSDGIPDGFARNIDHIARALLERIEATENALACIASYGGIDGDHHKAWVIDQVTRALTGDGYEAFVADAKSGEDGPETYDWNVGIAP